MKRREYEKYEEEKAKFPEIKPEIKSAVIVFPYRQANIFDPAPFLEEISQRYPGWIIIPDSVKIPPTVRRSLNAVILPDSTTRGFIRTIKKVAPHLRSAVLVGSDVHIERIVQNFESIFPKTKYRVLLFIAPSTIWKRVYAIRERILVGWLTLIKIVERR